MCAPPDRKIRCCGPGFATDESARPHARAALHCFPLTLSPSGCPFRRPRGRTQLSRNVGLEPYKRPVAGFSGNTAHSSGYHWGEAGTVYVGGNLGYGADNVTLAYSIQRNTFDPRCDPR